MDVNKMSQIMTSVTLAQSNKIQIHNRISKRHNYIRKTISKLPLKILIVILRITT